MSLMDDWWENPSTYSQWSDPDGQLAERYHQMNGRWPKGSRQHYEQQRREEEERRGPFKFEAHPSVHKPSSKFDDMLYQQLTLRTRKLGMRISADSYLMRSLRIEERDAMLSSMIGDMVYALEAKVLTEDLPPETINDSTVINHVYVYFGPGTWWDFWKLTYGHRWWCRWFVRWRPPRIVEKPQTSRWKVSHTVRGERFRMYPHADIRVEDKLGRSTIQMPIMTNMTSWLYESAADILREDR